MFLNIRNDGMEDRYSVLIELAAQSAADAFYFSLNGKRFSPAEVGKLRLKLLRYDPLLNNNFD